jgi:hypothetical protein
MMEDWFFAEVLHPYSMLFFRIEKSFRYPSTPWVADTKR